MSWFRPFFVTILACIAVFTLSRIGIVVWQYDRVAAVGSANLPFIFAQGLRFDLLTVAVLLGIPAALTPLFIVHKSLAEKWLPVVRVYCLLVIAVVVYVEVATPAFINEFDVKPDRRFIEYLLYPKEVFGMLWSAYKLQLFVAAAAVGLAVYMLNRTLRSALIPAVPLRAWTPLVLIPLVAFIVLAAVRSTTDHRPVNPSTVVYSQDPLANQLPLNSTYTTLYALYELRREDDKFAYAKVPLAEAVAAEREDMRVADEDFFDGGSSTLHRQIAARAYDHPINLVIVLEESLGADFVGSLGGLPLTPELDALHDDGIWFDNLYATGTRSVRGIEAVVAGFPPTTARSVVKLSRAQTGFFTIASLLAAQGYATSFLYSGEPQFDNMGRFFANNGFHTIIGRHDFTGEVFDGDWGAADEDLFNTADRYFREQPAGQPFFSLLFTTSNHSPFDYPEGRIEPYNSPAATVENAVKYADYALGEFIRNAKNSPYWDNTIFLIIADHSDRVYGDELVPIRLFHIPAVILGGPVQPQRIDRIASQLDMLPTLLSLLGINSEHPAIGIDQTRADLGDFPGRAVMQYAGTQAYMEGDRVAILQTGLPAAMYRYQNESLSAADPDPAFLQHAVDLANWPWQVYQNQAYCLPAICPKSIRPLTAVASTLQ
jgi:phosphoglycerol transferase MdoB-like AlkP superfamily enzyme